MPTVLAEWVYLGRALQRVTAGLLVALFLLGLIGGLVLQPKMRELHLIKYSMGADYKWPTSSPRGCTTGATTNGRRPPSMSA